MISADIAQFNLPESFRRQLPPGALETALCTRGAPAIVTPHKLYIEPLCIDVREVTVYLSDAHEIDLVRAIVRFRGFEVVVYVHADIPTDDQNTIVVCPDGGSCNERRLNTILIRTCIEEFVTLLAHNIGFYPLLTKPFALYGSPGEKSQKQLAREMQDLILTTIRVRVEFQ